jgi:hypothetical protein
MSKQPKRPTVAEAVFAAAVRLVRAGHGLFSDSDLVVEAWKADNVRFGLKGYNEWYPDSKRVLCEIMGKKPTNPLVLGWMEKVRPRVYCLTAAGLREAERLTHTEKTISPEGADGA